MRVHAACQTIEGDVCIASRCFTLILSKHVMHSTPSLIPPMLTTSSIQRPRLASGYIAWRRRYHLSIPPHPYPYPHRIASHRIASHQNKATVPKRDTCSCPPHQRHHSTTPSEREKQTYRLQSLGPRITTSTLLLLRSRLAAGDIRVVGGILLLRHCGCFEGVRRWRIWSFFPKRTRTSGSIPYLFWKEEKKKKSSSREWKVGDFER
jgi:hypothetical protein